LTIPSKSAWGGLFRPGLGSGRPPVRGDARSVVRVSSTLVAQALRQPRGQDGHCERGCHSACAWVGMNSPAQRSSGMHATNTGFDVFDVSLEMIRSLHPLIKQIQRCDADLTRQLKKAASSVPLNISEGRRRQGKDRRHLWRVAAGSADEVQSCLLVASAWGYVEADSLAESLALIDRILAMLWKLTR